MNKTNNLEKQLEEEKSNSSRRLEEELDRLTSREEEFKETICTLNKKMDNLSKKLSDREDQIKSMAQELEDRGTKSNEPSNHDREGNRNSNEMVKAKVKEILNLVFRQFKEKVDLEENYGGRDVLTLSMTVLKDATLSLLADSSEEDSEFSEEEDSDDEDPDDDLDEGGGDSPIAEELNQVQTTNSTEFEIPEAIVVFPHEQPQNSPTNSTPDQILTTEEGEPSHRFAEEDAPSNTSTEAGPQDLLHNADDGEDQVEGNLNSSPNAPRQNLNTEEFEAREEEDLWMAAPPSEPPPSPAPATFEPNLQHNTVSVEDITHLSTEVTHFVIFLSYLIPIYHSIYFISINFFSRDRQNVTIYQMIL